MTHVRAIVQARMSSARLRGKSLMGVSGKPLLGWVIGNIKQMSFVDSIVVATSDQESDDPIASYASTLEVDVVRGDCDDVLGRFVLASDSLDPVDVVLRFTADNPCYDPARSEQAFSQMAPGDDYVHVDGLSHMVPEFLRVGALRKSAGQAKESLEREHVSINIRNQPEEYCVRTLPADFAGLRPELDDCFTIDRLDQLESFEEMVRQVQAGHDCESVSLDDCYKWLSAKPEFALSPDVEGQKRVRFAGREVGDGCPCFVIAEIGQNHNGQVNLAKNLIDMAKRCGADAVKFQKRDIAWELTEEAYNKPYVGPNSFGETYGIHRHFLELDESQHRELREYALSQGLIYFCTPCDPPSVDVLQRIGNPIYKIASRDITNIPLLKHIAKTGKPVIISTGMAGMQEISEAIAAFEGSDCDVTLMQCISEYPAQAKNINLAAMKTMRDEFDVLVALSDHTAGVITGVAGAVLGAFAIEKHITVSRAMPGTDHAAALEEEGLRRLVQYIRTCREAMGDGVKQYNSVADGAKAKLARSLVSLEEIKAGTQLTEEMLTLKSPGTGLMWRDRDQVVGKTAKRDVQAQTTISPDDFS